MSFRVRLLLLLFLFLLPSGLVLFQSPVPAFAQGVDLQLQNEECRLTPHSEECICATVRKFGYFPKKFDRLGLYDVDRNLRGKDVDGDGKRPILGEDGVWVDEEGEAANANDEGDNEDKRFKKSSDLEWIADDRYKQRCALSYFREDQRRLWYFAVSLGGSFTVISLIWVGVVHMQNTASGVDISKTRAMLVRVIMGLIILACAFLIWEGLNELLFKGLDSWTLEQGVFHD